MMDSLDLLLDTARQGRAAQLSHFDALDSKAGITGGFAGGLVALSPNVSLWFRDATVASLGLAAILAAATFFPGNSPRWMSGTFVRRAEAEFTKLQLHDAQLTMVQSGSAEIQIKARLLKASVALLGIGAAILAVGIVVGGQHG
jgi:hypothetical protein